MSIMNMPPLPYVKRIPGLDYDGAEAGLHRSAAVWDSFDPAYAHAVQPRPAGDPPAGRARPTCCRSRCRPTSRWRRFDDEKRTAILRQLEKDIEAVRFDTARRRRSNCR